MKAITIIVTLLIAAFVQSLVPAAAAPENESSKSPTQLEKQVAEWVDALAKQKPFAAFQTADPQIEALGPGTHSWLVLFTQAGKNIGYMVVNAALDGTFKLGEYGLGPYPLFSYELLKQSLINGGMIASDQPMPAAVTKIYVHPFAAAWEVKIGEDTYYLDAKTAEQLPLDATTFPELFPTEYERLNRIENADKSTRIKLNPSFDVYERLPWLMKETPFSVKEVSKLQARLDKRQHLRYVTEPLGDKMLYALSVIGYQRWASGRVDVALDMDGQRFIPLSTLGPEGLFYR